MWPPVNSRNRERGNEFVPSKMENSMEREKKEQNRKHRKIPERQYYIHL